MGWRTTHAWARGCPMLSIIKERQCEDVWSVNLKPRPLPLWDKFLVLAMFQSLHFPLSELFLRVNSNRWVGCQTTNNTIYTRIAIWGLHYISVVSAPCCWMVKHWIGAFVLLLHESWPQEYSRWTLLKDGGPQVDEHGLYMACLETPIRLGALNLSHYIYTNTVGLYVILWFC